MLSKRLSRRRFVTCLGMIGSGLALFRPHQIAHAEKAEEEEEAGKVSRRKRSGTTRVGIALGGGGAKGLAHILMLEALDELGGHAVVHLGVQYGGGHRGAVCLRPVR